MENKKILSGSNAFFKGLSGFNPHDIDYVILHYNTENTFKHIIKDNICYFIYNFVDKNSLIYYICNNLDTLCVASLLTPGVIKELNLTIDDLNTFDVRKCVFNLPTKWKYLKYIFECYIENNETELTNEQRLNAFELYKHTRNSKKR